MIPGVFASDRNIVGTRKGDFAAGILKVNPTGSAPMLALTSGMKSTDAMDVVVTWFEEGHMTGRSTVVTGGNTAATSLIVDDGSQYVPNTIIMSEESGEYFFITGVSSNTLTVERGFANTTAATVSTGHHFQRIGTAFEEGSSRPTALAQIGAPLFNFVQIFRNAWDVTGTARAVEFITGDVVAKNKADCGQYHAEDMERALLWGRKSIGTRNGKPFRTMDGLTSMLSTNVSSTATMTYAGLNTFLQSLFAKNIKGYPNERIVFCGSDWIRIINQVAVNNSAVQLQIGATEFGMKITKWMSPFGDISLMTHPIMNESPNWTKDAYFFHPGAITTRYLRRTQPDDYDRAGTRAGVDADYGVLTTEMSVQYAAEQTGAKWTGLTTAGT